MPAESIQIEGPFDVAIARNRLRRKVAEQGWMPTFRARAAAALTAMAELILFSQACGSIDMSIVDREGKTGVELAGGVSWPDSRYVWLDEARSRLARVTDELEIVDTPDGPRIVARVWLYQDEGRR
ncbi:MAG: hypothetical protein JXB47_07715 [Anaerolineae bacterium]|nr:hypothetical protein [Anaerolineae bacterium]